MNLHKKKFTSKFVSIILILGLIFSMNSFVFAEDFASPAATDVDITEQAVETEKTEPEFPIKEDPAPAAALQEDIPVEAKAKAAAASVDNELRIKSVEVLTRGDFQNIYRDTVYKGKAANGEDPTKYYTTYREFNLKDPRIFNLEYDVDAATVDAVSTDPAVYLDSVELYYGGVPIGEWGNGNNLRGNTDILILVDGSKGIIDNNDGTYTVGLSLRSNSPWNSSNANANSNIPYSGYVAGGQGHFGSGQTADNRAWWQAGPVYKGMGTYELAAMVNEESVAATDVHIGPYDEMNSWIEMNEWAQSLVKAITGNEIAISELDEKPTGKVAEGYVALDKEGNFVKGTAKRNVWVEVSINGYGLTDNYKPENAGFNNYSRFNPMWNVVVSYDEDTVDTYLDETVPLMNEDPEKLINKYKNKDPEDIDMVNVYYQNNVHSDEVSGTDTEIKLITDMIEGGKVGKDITYKTYEDSDMNYRYRVPTDGYERSTSSHVVKDAYSGRFLDPDSRNEIDFNTSDALEQLIFVTTITSNPDGKAGMRRVNRYAMDNNRDSNYATQPETIALTKDVCKWDPLIMNEWHGYVSQMLIEPCTAPHDPAFDYDLLQNNMLKLSYTAGKAVTASTGYSNFRVPWDQLSNGGWDDGGTVYTPMLVMLLGTYGYTIELPHSNSDSFEAGNVINYAMINELMDGETQFYPGNALNGELLDSEGKTRESHEVDNKYTSMRKSTVMNKLETKRRGVENIDSMDADKYFIDVVGGKEVVVGRPRPADSEGKTLSYFPDYIVIPMDDKNQYNVAEGIKGINWMMKLGVKVSVATDDVTYNGQKIPKGAYVFDMKQGKRNLIYEFMSKGYDATNFSSMYADIYCNFPDVRGYDSIQIYSDGLYKGKLKEIDSQIEKVANIDGNVDDYVIFKSQSTDAVRFVNLLLSGKSSGGSTAKKGDVWMLRKDVDGVGNASDYIIRTKDLSKINNLKDDVNLGLHGCMIEGQYISDLPKEATELVEPIIQFNTSRTAQSGGVLWWALDDYLGFGSMSDYNGSTSLREGANVVVSNNTAPNSEILSAVKEQKLGLVLIQNASVLNNANFGTGSGSPSATAFSDVALNGKYNVDDSLFTANYADTTTLYSRGNGFTNIPQGSKVLFKTVENGNDAFIGGFQNIGGNKDRFGDKTTIFSTILKGGGIEGKPVQALAIGQNMHYRAHYQKLLPMLATGIYAGAAGILDDQNNPEIGAIQIDGSDFTITAEEPESGVVESGIEAMSVYQWNGNKYVQIAEQDSGEYSFKSDPEKDLQLKIVATDYAGNEVTKFALYNAEDGSFSYLNEDKAILNYDSGGGTSYEPKVYKLGQTLGSLPEPTRDGHIFIGWFTDASSKIPVTEDTRITSDMTIYAGWNLIPPVQITRYTVTSTSYTGGTITETSDFDKGANATFTYTPDSDYKVSALYVDGNLVASDAKGGTYTFSNISANHTISVVFEADIKVIEPTSFGVKTEASAGGTITASGNYQPGSNATIAYKPNTGYLVSKLYVDDNLVASDPKGGTYTFKKISADHTIQVLFEADTSVLGEAAKPTKAAPKNFKVKAQSKKAKLTWKKSSGVTKYQVAYKQKGQKKWAYKTVSNKKASVTISKLKSSKDYQFKIRSYKTTNGKKVYSKWSKTKTVKIKSK